MSDPYRDSANAAVIEFMDQHRTNAVGAPYVWQAVNAALDAYDDEFVRSAETRLEFCIMLGTQPMLACPTKRIARQQLKLMKRMADHKGAWRITRVQVAYDS